MPSQSLSEVGHAKNIANLNLLNTHLAALGSQYNPTNPAIALTALQTLYDNAHQRQQEVNQLTAPYALAVDDREALFKPLGKHLTRLSKAYQVTQGVTGAQMQDLKTIIRKIKGEKAPTTQATTPGGTTHSTSQMSYDQRTNHMGLLVSLLQHTPNYAPNEAEFTADATADKKLLMLTKTQAVHDCYIPLNNARAQRNQILYDATDNLVDTARKAIAYTGTILEKNSPQYKAIAAIKFQKIKA